MTDAILAVLRVQKKEQTTANMREVLKTGILTIDRYPVPQDIGINKLRNLIQMIDFKLQKEETRIILRMPTKPYAGLIVAGNIERAKHILDNALGK